MQRVNQFMLANTTYNALLNENSPYHLLQLQLRPWKQISPRLSSVDHHGQNSHCLTVQNACFAKSLLEKKIKALLNVSTYMACKTILAAAKVRGDERMLLVLRGVNNDQCAAELKYHHNCHASYTSIKSVKTTKPGTSTEYANAFADLTATIVPKLVAGTAYDMTSLLHKHQVLLENQGVEPDNYT